jgi:hypothetical protein
MSRLLSEVISAAESGDWEQLESLAQDYAKAADRLTRTEHPPLSPEDRAAITTLLLHHEHAMQLCRERLQQITPLVQALSAGNSGSSSNP